jgi:hypothetical protein
MEKKETGRGEKGRLGRKKKRERGEEVWGFSF